MILCLQTKIRTHDSRIKRNGSMTRWTTKLHTDKTATAMTTEKINHDKFLIYYYNEEREEKKKE